MQATILVVDQRRAARRALSTELAEAGFRVIEAADGLEAYALFQREAPDLVLSDLAMPLCDGIELVERIRVNSQVPIVLFSSEAGVPQAVAAVKCGADDFVASEDLEIDEIVALAQRKLGAGIRAAEQFEDALPGRNPAIVRARDRLEAIAPLSEPVLVLGEPGTGRVAAVAALHRVSRPLGPLQTLDAVAYDDWPDLPRRGTAHVVNVERMSPPAQVAWLRRLERDRGDVRWVASGGTSVVDPDGSLIAALRDRLARFCVSLPTLRERPEDVPRIARRLAERAGVRLGRSHRLGTMALERLRSSSWPGNMAELDAVIERAAAFSTQSEIDVTTVSDAMSEVRWSIEGLRDARARDERESLLGALEATGGNVTRTAARLGRSRAAIYRMVERHGVPLRRDT